MNDAMPERLPAGTGIVPELDPEVVVQTLTIANPEPGKKAEKTYKNEKDVHRKALDYYFLLGAERSLEKVATQFKVKKSLVLR